MNHQLSNGYYRSGQKKETIINAIRNYYSYKYLFEIAETEKPNTKIKSIGVLESATELIQHKSYFTTSMST